MRERLTIEIPLLWRYSLIEAGFEVEVSAQLPDKTIVLNNVMPWGTFVQGLALGWEQFHQYDPEFTRIINEFIIAQIELGNYTPGEGASHEEQEVEPSPDREGVPALAEE
jgi:hypothetical protein